MDTTGGPSLTCGQQNDGASFEDNPRQSMDKRQSNTRAPRPHMLWKILN